MNLRKGKPKSRALPLSQGLAQFATWGVISSARPPPPGEGARDTELGVSLQAAWAYRGERWRGESPRDVQRVPLSFQLIEMSTDVWSWGKNDLNGAGVQSPGTWGAGKSLCSHQQSEKKKKNSVNIGHWLEYWKSYHSGAEQISSSAKGYSDSTLQKFYSKAQKDQMILK